MCMTLLQPAWELMERFQSTLVLEKGCCYYFGPSPQMMPYFNSLGYKVPQGVALCDYLLQIPSPQVPHPLPYLTANP